MILIFASTRCIRLVTKNRVWIRTLKFEQRFCTTTGVRGHRGPPQFATNE